MLYVLKSKDCTSSGNHTYYGRYGIPCGEHMDVSKIEYAEVYTERQVKEILNSDLGIDKDFEPMELTKDQIKRIYNMLDAISNSISRSMFMLDAEIGR